MVVNSYMVRKGEKILHSLHEEWMAGKVTETERTIFTQPVSVIVNSSILFLIGSLTFNIGLLSLDIYRTSLNHLFSKFGH